MTVEMRHRLQGNRRAAAPAHALRRRRKEPLAMWTKQVWSEVAAELFDNEGLATVFQHARNVLTGAAVVGAGMYAVHHMETSSRLAGLWNVHLAGYAVAIMGAVLLALNLLDGLRRLAKRRHRLMLRVLAILVYVALSLRLIQVIIYFRYAA